MQIEIVAALRVKNEARWIAEVLESVSWCTRTYLLDDHSTDDTVGIARDCRAFVLPSPLQGLDEARDKEYLSQHIAERHPLGAYVLMIDGDEVLEPGGREKILQHIAAVPAALGFTLRVLYLWDSRDQIRVDGVYGHFSRPSIFKISADLTFRRTEQNGHLHCSSVPAAAIGKCVPCPAALLHLGYMDREDRIRKWKFYNSIDPKNKIEGWDSSHPERGSYPHVVQGDIPEVPATIALLQAGPLKLINIPVNRP